MLIILKPQVWAISDAPPPGRGARGAQGLTLTAKPVTLKDHRGAPFVATAAAPAPVGQPPGSFGVYVLSGAGCLVLMRATGRMPDRAVDLQVGAWALEWHALAGLRARAVRVLDIRYAQGPATQAPVERASLQGCWQ